MIKNLISDVSPNPSRTVSFSIVFPISNTIVDATGDDITLVSRLLCGHGAKFNAYIAGIALKPDSQDTKAKVQRLGHIVLSRNVIYLKQSPSSTPIVALRRASQNSEKEEGENREDRGERSYKVAVRTGFCIPETTFRVSLSLYDLVSLAYGQVAIFNKCRQKYLTLI